ncbi:hypothetical protein [Vibrio agarivorans]|uniref:Uncharacterized protein n=1 Tax=Vibrio agarivorans TaxID=153622 RepID=A0ABT7Y7A7_9VIBR|nr:hypothetical protein [Vibrio agarivorans]MDN2483909.1 hypothetical protein [Vibrio agarivorans]
MAKQPTILERINAELATLAPTESMIAIFDDASVKTCEYIIKQTTEEDYKKIFNAIVRIKAVEQINLIGMSLIHEYSALNKEKCRRLLKPLLDTSVIKTLTFKKDLQIEKCHQHLKLQIISPISSVDEEDLNILKVDKTKTSLALAKKNAKKYKAQLETELSVNLDKKTIKTVRNQPVASPLQLNENITELCSPGSSINAKRTKAVKLSSGIYNNRSMSSYGIMNGFDRKCLNILNQITKAYVRHHHPSLTPSELQAVWIPFITTELVERHGLGEGSHSSKRVCESLLRICETRFYINTESSVIIEGKASKSEMHKFAVMKDYKIAGKEELREKVINPFNNDDEQYLMEFTQNSDDNATVEERIKEDHGENIPFLAVFCRWNDAYYEDLQNDDSPIQEIDVKINMLPPCLFEFHEFLKLHYQNKTSVFSRGRSFKFELFTIIELIYPTESDENKRFLVQEFIHDCKLMKNKSRVTRSVERRNKNADIVYIDLFGFVFSIKINNWDKPEAAANYSSIVSCKANLSSPHLEQLLVETKINFDSNARRLARSTIGRNIKSVIGPIKRKRYIISFNVSGIDFYLSKYDSLEARSIIRDSIISCAKQTGTPLSPSSVELFLNNLTDKLGLFNGVDVELLNKICEVTLMQRHEVINKLSYRSKRTIELSLKTNEEIKEFFGVKD